MNIQIAIAVNVHNDYMASNLSNLLVDGIGFEMTEETMCERVLTMDYAEYKRATADRMMAVELEGVTERYINSYMSKLTKEIQ